MLLHIAVSQGQPTAMSAPAPSHLKDRLYFGGNVGLQFGNQTVIGLNPIIGYKVTERFSSGVGLKYQYYRYKEAGFSYETNTYGGSVFGRYNVYNGLFAYSEYEILNMEVYENQIQSPLRRNVDSWFVGGGYSQPLGARSSVFIMVLYNLTESYYTPYSNPLFRMGFGIGI
jgi:outer membrane protein assembly factor BamA